MSENAWCLVLGVWCLSDWCMVYGVDVVVDVGIAPHPTLIHLYPANQTSLARSMEIPVYMASPVRPRWGAKFDMMKELAVFALKQEAKERLGIDLYGIGAARQALESQIVV
jgi:hypothetical protein